MTIESSVFESGGSIPKEYTCDGEDINPPLRFSAVPGAAKSLALICHDHDAKGGDFTHWTLWNVSPSVQEIAAGAIPVGAVAGMTDFGKIGWGGPCPPEGEHRYEFHLYALDTLLTLPVTAKKAKLLEAMQGHILEEASLTGLYQREKTG